MALSELNLKRIQESINDLLECGVCKEVFEDARMLPCIHSFCLKCLKAMLISCPGTKIICPMCRSELPVPESGIEGLHKNIFLARLKETMQIVNSTSCDSCHKNSVEGGELPNAEMYCSDCKEKLCSQCCINHIKNVSHKRHELDNLEHKIKTDPGASVYCDIHKQYPIDIYCLKCREVLCAMCYIEKHPYHERKLIMDISQIFRDQIQQSIARLSPDKDIFMKQKDELENAKSAILLDTAQLEKTIMDIRDAIVKRADDDAKSLLFMLSMKVKEKQKDVEILTGDVMFKYSCLDSYLSYCNGLAREGSNVDICREVHLLEARSNELQQSATGNLLSSEVRFQMQFVKTDNEAFMAQTNIIGELSEVQDCSKVHCEVEESDNDVMKVKSMTTDISNVKLKSLSVTCQSSVKAADTKDTGESNTTTRIKTDAEVSSTSESEGSGFLSSSEETFIQSLESSCEMSDIGSVPAKTEGKQSSFFNRMFPRSYSGGDSSDTDSSYSEKRSSFSEDGNHDPVCIHTIKTISTQPISGMAILYHELYVVSDANSTIEVYDTKTFALLREMRISRLVDPGDIASCESSSCIYITDWKSRGEVNEILKVNATGTLMKKWSTPDDYSWLSVTHETNVVLTLNEENAINEYKPNGNLIRSVRISKKSGVHHIWHAVKLSNGDFVIGHGLKNCYRVCQVDIHGTVKNSFGENTGVQRLRSAVYLAVDWRGLILVVDQSRGKVVQLNSNLEFQKQLSTRKHNLRSPARIHLDVSKGWLFVADRKCLISIFTFG